MLGLELAMSRKRLTASMTSGCGGVWGVSEMVRLLIELILERLLSVTAGEC